MSDQATDLPDDLTDEEREALTYQEPAEDVNASEQQPEADPDETPVEDAGADPAADVPAAGADDAQPTAAADANAAPAAAPSAEVAEQPQAAPQPAPILIANAPADAQDKLAKIAADKAELLDKYEAGEITAKELHLQQDALNEQQFEIKQQLREAELAQRMEAQRSQNEWSSNVNSFLTSHSAEYLGEANAARWNALDGAIKYLNTLPENQGITGPNMLAKAHAFVEALHGKHPSAAQAAPQQKQKIDQPVVPKPAIPPTNIGKLPAADANDTSGGEFAALDALAKGPDVEAYENAVASLSESQRNRWLAR